MRRCGPRCATTPRTIRDGVSAPVSQRPRRRLGNQSRENAMPLARRRASSATAPPAQRPRQLHCTTDRNRGCTQSGVVGGLPVRRHHRRVPLSRLATERATFPAVRQGTRISLPRNGRLVIGSGWSARHSAHIAVAQRLCRVDQLPHPRRVPQHQQLLVTGPRGH